MNVDDSLDAPLVDMPINPAPGDCMPTMLAAGRVAPIVKIKYYDGTAWDVCDMDLARSVLADRRLSKDIALTPDWMRVPGEFTGSQPSAEVARAMVMSDGPEHTRIRNLHARIFTPRNTEKWATGLAPLAEELLDGLAAEAAAGDGEVNLVEGYTHPIPRGSICKMIGLPPGMHAELKRVTDDIIYSPDLAVRGRGIGTLVAAVAGWANDPSPLQEGVMTALLEAVDGEAAVTINEVVTWTVGLVMAGYESTASLIASAMLEALRKPAGQRPGSEAEIEAWIGGDPPGASAVPARDLAVRHRGPRPWRPSHPQGCSCADQRSGGQPLSARGARGRFRPERIPRPPQLRRRSPLLSRCAAGPPGGQDRPERLPVPLPERQAQRDHRRELGVRLVDPPHQRPARRIGRRRLVPTRPRKARPPWLRQ